MKIVTDILLAFRANVKCFSLKLMHMKTLYYHPYIRMDRNVNIRLRGGVITLGKGVLVSARSVISASDGGRLTVGKMVGINSNSMLMCHNSISIGSNTIMGPGRIFMTMIMCLTLNMESAEMNILPLLSLLERTAG